MRLRFGWLIALLLVFLLVLSGCAGEGSPSSNSVHQPLAHSNPTQVESPPSHPSALSTISDLSEQIADVVEQVMPAVVYISAEVVSESFFFGPVVTTQSGSGVILDPEGYILTNNHVVEGARKIEVTLSQAGDTLSAKLVGTDPLSDLAVIRIKGQNLPYARFGDASKLRPGNLVIAIGNPLGLQGGPTVTLGVVSNLGRSFRVGESTYYDVIQTDAAINPGNSGGPLVNLQGEVVGINSVMVSGAQNIGFAISANTAKPVFEALVRPPHRVIRAWLGVVLQTVTSKLASEQGLARSSGVLIRRVEKDSPAYRAGLRAGDIITRFQDQEVTEATQLIKAIWECKVGQRVRITFWRGQEEKQVWVVLAERPRGM